MTAGDLPPQRRRPLVAHLTEEEDAPVLGDLPEGQQPKDLPALVAEVMHTALDAADENWHLSCMDPDGDGSCSKGHYARRMLAEDVAPKVIEAVVARVRADTLRSAAADLLATDAHEDLCSYGPPGTCDCALGEHYRWLMARAETPAVPAESVVGAPPDQAGTRQQDELADLRSRLKATSDALNAARNQLHLANRAKAHLFARIIASSHLLEKPFTNAPEQSPWTKVSMAMSALTEALTTAVGPPGGGQPNASDLGSVETQKGNTE